MDEILYEDKQSSDITKEMYEVKHEQFVKEKAEFQALFDKLDTIMSDRLEQRLGILELSQRAAEIYKHKSPE